MPRWKRRVCFSCYLTCQKNNSPGSPTTTLGFRWFPNHHNFSRGFLIIQKETTIFLIWWRADFWVFRDAVSGCHLLLLHPPQELKIELVLGPGKCCVFSKFGIYEFSGEKERFLKVNQLLNFGRVYVLLGKSFRGSFPVYPSMRPLQVYMCVLCMCVATQEL